MKLLKTYIVIINLALFTGAVNGDDFEQASIGVSATVIPMTGFLIQSDDNLLFPTIDENESTLLIQTSKNAELFVTFTSLYNKSYHRIILTSEQSVLSEQKNSVIDIVPINLLKSQTESNLPQIITVSRIDI